jgi:phosphatidylserine/phosphatidylglycerophosphate/cardiolipin synthase-like enzyme
MTASGRDRSFAGHRRSKTIRSGLLTLSIFAAALALCADVRMRPAFAAQIEVCFSPPLPGGCDPNAAVVSAIASARRSILMQAYAMTAQPIAAALLHAHRRGVDVRLIVDRKQLMDDPHDTFTVRRLGAASIPVLVDGTPGLMHDKVMTIDGEVVVTGSYNYTWSAEHKNVENVLVIRDPALAAQYVQHWKSRAAESRPLDVRQSTGINPDLPDTTAADSAMPSGAAYGPVVGNRRSRIYEWPGCPYYDSISPRQRVEFASAQAAEQAGYRAAHNCR